MSGAEEVKVIDNTYVTKEQYDKHQYATHGQNTEYYKDSLEMIKQKIVPTKPWDDIGPNNREVRPDGTETRWVCVDHYQYRIIFEHAVEHSWNQQEYTEPGNYEVPFCFTLPKGIPPSLEISYLKDSGYAYIAYFVEARIQIEEIEHPEHNFVKWRSYFIVNPTFVSDGKPKKATVEHLTTSCFCIKGATKVEATLDKCDYKTDEIPNVIVEADNSNSGQNF